MTDAGRSLQLYFIDGRPDGMLTAEMFNWTGHVLSTPRTRLSEALARAEAGQTGVYLLIGEKDGSPITYIGESDDIATRIKQHDTQRDWWTKAVLVTSNANNLHKAHVRYLEARLVEEARNAGANLENGNTPPRGSLSEADRTNMEAFLSIILMMLPAIRVDLFIKDVRPADPAKIILQQTGPVFEMETVKHGVRGEAMIRDGEFVVKAGSVARATWEGAPGHSPSYSALHAQLLETGVLRLSGDHATFADNYAFSSPTAAAVVINGRSTNGQTAWKLKGTNRTYKDWEQASLSSQPVPLKEAAE